MRWTNPGTKQAGTVCMDNIRAAVAEAKRSVVGATAAAFMAMERPSPISIIPPRGGNAIMDFLLLFLFWQ